MWWHDALRVARSRHRRAPRAVCATVLGLAALACWRSAVLLNRQAASDDGLTLMWVTECDSMTEWSSALLLWSALRVGQEGRFVRVATGCDPPARAALQRRTAQIAALFGAGQRVTVHFAPKHVSDARDGTAGEVYLPYTKPFGVLHFLEHGPAPSGGVGVLLDPDFLFNRPLTVGQPGEPVLLPHSTPPADATRGVGPGRPVGQEYGLGNGWLEYDRRDICGPASPCANVSDADATRYFRMGPPVFVRMQEWPRLAKLWYDFLPRIRRTRKDWMEEMRAFTMAAAHLELRTTVLRHFMVSAPDAGSEGEAWEWLQPGNGLPDPCHEGKAVTSFNFPDIDLRRHPLPPILHYCASYEPFHPDGRPYLFSKYQINRDYLRWTPPGPWNRTQPVGDVLACSAPLHELPPTDLLRAQPRTGPCRGEWRKAWAVCQVQNALNEMLAHLKRHTCDPAAANFRRAVRHAYDAKTTECSPPHR